MPFTIKEFLLVFKFKVLKYPLLFILFFCTINIHAQYLDSLPPVLFKGKLKNRTLLLRIVPLSGKAWRALNSSQISKYSSSETTIYNLALQPSNLWKNDTLNNELFLGSYKLNFESDEILKEELPKSTEGLPFVYSQEELEQFRYVFNFIACNQNFNLAQKNGLAYVDTRFEVRRDARYVLKSSILDSLLIIYNDQKLETSAKPPKPSYSISQNQFLFEWPSMPYFLQYFAFNLEKSYDGKKYQLINTAPIVNFHTGDTQAGFRSYFSFQDTLSHGVTLYYRLRGIDYFGDQSEAGEPLVINMPKLITNPLINFSEIKNKNLNIHWDFNKNDESEISSFSIWVSDSADGFERKKIRENISKLSRSITLDYEAKSTKFYFIEAVRLNAPGVFSYAKMIVHYDDIPPNRPSEPSGQMDENGKIQLTWPANIDTDLMGYRVFRSVDTTAEFSQITDKPTYHTGFQDSISLNTLTKKIYYKIAAVDQNLNQSLLSPYGSIAVFDTVSPSEPSFYFYRPEANQVHLKWYNSSSVDIAHSTLYRRSRTANQDWIQIKRTAGHQISDSIIDKSLDPTIYYEYMLVAEDYAGNRSNQSKPLVAKPLFAAFLPPIENIELIYNKESNKNRLSWKYDESNILEYWIYKKKNDEPLTLFKQVSALVDFIEDEFVLDKSIYTYKIKAVHESGRESKISKPLNISINR